MAQTTQSVHSDVLDRVRKAPYATLGQASLACLPAFLDGYKSGSGRAARANDLDPRLGRFSEWVAEKLGRRSLSVSGVWMIRLESEDETRALERYFELWDEYTSLVEPVPVADTVPPPVLPVVDFRQLLVSIRRRPAMYLGHSSVTLLRAFLQGYVTALQDAGRSTDEVPDLDRFSRWLCARYGLRDGYRWDRLLLTFHSDEAKALEEFFKLLDEFEAGMDPSR